MLKFCMSSLRGFITILFVMCFIHLSNAFRAGAGIRARIAIYRPTSQGSRMAKIIGADWDCNPFAKCTSNDFDCFLENCPFNKTIATDCPNQIVGQYSSMCLEIGKNNLKQKIFLGKSFSLVLEPNVVAKCTKYNLYSQFVSECELFRVDQVDEKLTETINEKENFHVVYYRTTRSVLEKERKQFELMEKQMKFNKIDIELNLNDYRMVDFDIQKQADTHQFRVSTNSDYSFTLPAWETEKHTLPVYAKLNMGLELHDNCYWLYEDEKLVRIKKRLSCYLSELLSF